MKNLGVNSTMKRLLRAIEVLAWSAFFVFAALILVLRFWVLPNVERFREDIVSAVSRTVGQPVKIGAIEAGWLGLRPQVSLFDVRVYDASGREALVLPAVDNVVSWRSLVFHELRLHSLTIDRPRLDVRRDASGAIFVAGMKLSKRGDGRFTDWLLSQEEIVVRNAEVEWHDDKRGAPPLALSGVDLRLRNSGDDHSIGLSARPPAQLGSTLDVRAELAGRSTAEPSAWSGRLFVELGSTSLSGWRHWIDPPLDIVQGEGALRMWATLDRGEATRATLDVELARFAARLGKELRLLELASLSGRIQLQARDGGYEIAGRQLALAAQSGPAMSPADFRVAWRPAIKSDAERGSVIANVIELEPLAYLAESLPFPEGARKLLGELAPRGRVLDAKLDWTGPLADPTQFHARGRFAELGVRASGKRPGFSGLSGTVDANEAKGSIQLSARKAEIDLPAVLSHPRVPLDALHGQIDWSRRAPRVTTISLSGIAFSNPHLEGKASGSYTHSDNGPGASDLTVQLSRADARYTALYLPLPSIMGQATHDWLANAILAGQASDVRLKLRGELRDFPFHDPARGQFSVTARVEKGVLDYASGWPRMSDIDAQLAFERARMEITGRSATILGAKLAGVQVVIPRLAPGAVVTVNGQAEGPTGEFLKYIESTPVRRMAGGFTDAISATGRGKLRLKLDLPLAELPATRVAGEFELQANTVSVLAQLPPLERATGKLSFTESSFTLNDVRARVFGGAVALSGGWLPGTGVEVVARGDAAVATLQPLFDHPWWRHLAGSAAYVATVNVRDGRSRISVESSLRGVSSVLPPPLSKAAADALALKVDVVPADGGTRDRVSVSLGRVAMAEFLRRRQGEAMVVQRAGIWLSPTGEQPVRVPERPGMLVYGSLAALDFDRWQPVLAGDEGAAASSERAPESATPATSVDLKVGTLDAYGKRVHEMALRAGSDAAGWSATVQSTELAGDVSYRNEKASDKGSEKGGNLVARLTHFTMPGDSPGAKPRDPGTTRELPSVDLAAERFGYRGKQFGRVELVAQRAGANWRIDKMTMVNPESSLTATGLWQTVPASHTSLSFELETSDAGKFLARIGYPDLVRAGKAKAQGAVGWNSEPTTPDYSSLTGDVQMQAENGQFLEIEPGIGKLVSLMSLQALPKRLTLDFRDVFSKGFQFDRITSSAHIERGVMVLKDFKMRGSAAEVDMTGEVDLAKETQKLHVRVIPSLGDSASTVIALLNPLLVFPAALAQKILKDPLGHIFAFDYSITGGWSDPKVAKTRVAAESVQHAPSDK